VISKRDMYDELAFGGVAGNVPFTCRILRENDASRWESTDIAITCLKFDFAG